MLFLFASESVSAQGVVYNSAHLNEMVGLPGVSVRCVFKDSKGYIWIGVEEKGLYLYDGYTYTSYADSAGISVLTDSSIEAMDEDVKGNLWIATLTGLNYYDKSTKEVTQFLSSKTDVNTINSNVCLSVKVRKDKDIWVGTWEGISRIDAVTNKITRFLMAKGAKATITYDVWVDAKNQVWFATDKGIFLFDDSTQTMVQKDLGEQSKSSFSVISSDKNGRYWCSNGSFVYTSVDGEVWTTIEQEEAQGFRGILRFAFDANENLWIYSGNKGITIIDTQTLEIKPFFSRSTVDKLDVRSMIADNTGNIWLGTKFFGVFIFNPSSSVFPLYGYGNTKTTALSDKYVMAIATDTANTVWIGTKRTGMFEFNLATKEITPLPFTETLKSKVSYLLVTPDNRLWCMIDHKIFVINSERTKIEGIDYIRQARALTADSQGRIWVSTKQQGIQIIDPVTYSVSDFDPKNPLWNTNQGINQLIFDKQGRLWITTQANGLIRYDSLSHELKHYKHDQDNKNTLNSNFVRAILEDSKGRIWIGTKNGGACLYQPETDDFSRILEYHKSGKYSVFSMQDDLAGNIWMGTFTGLVRYNHKESTSETFTEEFGLQSNIFEANASCTLPNGDMLFGGQAGFNMFSPQKIAKPTIDIQLVMNSILMKEKELGIQLDSGKSFTLNYDENYLSFDYSLLDYISPKGCKYSFRMDGVDGRWSTYSFRNFTTYTNLNPGNYIFHVRAVNRHGITAKNELTYKFEIRAPFWKTWWFYLLEFAILVSIVYAIISIRVRIIKEQKKELEKTVAQRTQQLSLANESLLMRNEEVMQQNEEIITQKDALEEQNQIIKKSYHDAEVFNKLGQSITSSLDHHNISAIVHNHLKEVWHLSVFGLGLVNKGQSKLIFEYFFEYERQIEDFSVELAEEQDAFAWCLRHQKSLNIKDSRSDNSDQLPTLLNVSLEHDARSMVLIPLFVASRAIGFLVLMSEHTHAFSESDYSNIRTLSSYIAIALDNANAYNDLERQNEHTLASIKYAKRIQMTILPAIEHIHEHLDAFLFFKPKDIVSGDFYWFVHTEVQGKEYTFAAAVDCTGHGVPGAFMSLIGNRILSEIVLRTGLVSPKQILEELHQRVSLALHADGESSTDGMDVCLVRLEKVERRSSTYFDVVFSGAKRPLYIWNSDANEIQIIKGTKRSINGRMRKGHVVEFENNELKINSNDTLYLSSDGFADQPNSERHPVGSPRLLAELSKHAMDDLATQERELHRFLNAYQGDTPQRDDITIFALRPNAKLASR